MAKNSFDELERQEIIQILIDKGYGEIIDALLMNESRVYTKKGRMNKSGACRVLGWKTKQLEDIMEECKNLFPDLFEEN
jgi:hypothetical protein